MRIDYLHILCIKKGETQCASLFLGTGKMKKYRMMLLLLIVGMVLVSCSMEQEYAEYMVLREPRVTEVNSLRVLVCKVEGEPGRIQRKAMRALYKAFDQLQSGNDTLNLVRMPIRARWPDVLRTSREEWVGIFALPIPKTITEIPIFEGLDDVLVSLDNWDYGIMAEILYVGAYKSDQVAIDKLHRYIVENGYQITGLHEEEYISGPGIYFDGDPDRYITIIRYPVQVNEDDTDRILDYGD